MAPKFDTIKTYLQKEHNHFTGIFRGRAKKVFFVENNMASFNIELKNNKCHFMNDFLQIEVPQVIETNFMKTQQMRL